MHLEEITDEMAAKLQVSSRQDAQEPAPGANAPGQPAAAGPGLSPGRAMTKNMTVDEVVADLKKSPFFMTELEENDDIEALKALAYEGSPFEVASGFKGRGNECFKARGWMDAKEFYTKGILVLLSEERKRAAAVCGEPAAEGAEAEAEATPQEVEEQRQLLESLYVNRAACHLGLKNYRSCWLDGAAALRLNPRNLKAYYRCAKAFLAVDRIEEADDACARGLELDPENAALKAAADDIVKRSEQVTARRRKEEERIARERRRDLLLKTALKARNITMRSTEKPPDMEDAKVQLVPDPDDPRSSVSFPTVLLYPADLESDFIKAFNENETVSDHLGYVFPLPWDQKGEYSLANVECYMDTVSGGLIKVGKKVPLLKVLSSDKVEVIDQVVRIFVVPKAKAEAWAQEYKKQRALQRGN